MEFAPESSSNVGNRTITRGGSLCLSIRWDPQAEQEPRRLPGDASYAESSDSSVVQRNRHRSTPTVEMKAARFALKQIVH
jgi:hypothetical protein